MIGVTNHAVERYQARVKPHLGATQARRELYALLDLAETVERPRWDLSRAHTAADAYLLIAPDCVAIVVDGAVVTVITKEKAVEPARRRRKDVKRLRAQVAAAQRETRRDRTRFRKGRKMPTTPNRRRARIEDEAWPI